MTTTMPNTDLVYTCAPKPTLPGRTRAYYLYYNALGLIDGHEFDQLLNDLIDDWFNAYSEGHF